MQAERLRKEGRKEGVNGREKHDGPRRNQGGAGERREKRQGKELVISDYSFVFGEGGRGKQRTFRMEAPRQSGIMGEETGGGKRQKRKVI